MSSMEDNTLQKQHPMTAYHVFTNEVYENEEAMLHDEMLEEDCHLGYGLFPF